MSSDERQVQVLIEQADAQRALGNHRAAIELLQRALALDPDHARAHSALALALLGARRLSSAVIEMHAALHLDGNDAHVHYVAACVLRSSRKLDDAWAHCLIALEGPSADAATHVLGSEICTLKGDRARARELLDEALALEAAHTGALTALARLDLRDGKIEAAAANARSALESNPSDPGARVVAGLVDLARGDVASAEQHARFVLQIDANDHGGLELWTAVKARRSMWLGAWWRLNSWLTLRDDTHRIALLIGMFVVVRVLVIVTDELGYEALSRVLSLAWYALCAYTWIGPLMFRRWMQEELGTVKLDPSF